MKYWRVRNREPEQTTQTLYEWVRLRLSPGAQGSLPTMKELVTQGKNAGIPILWSVSKKDSGTVSLT